MSREEPNTNNYACLDPGSLRHLSILEGGVQSETNDSAAENFEENRFQAIRVEVPESDESGDNRVEVLTLRNGRRYACKVTEADRDLVPEVGEAGMTVLLPGFTEIPSSKNTTASNLHDGYASRRRDQQVVSIDRIGYSSYAGPGSPVEAVRLALQSKEEAANDIIEVSAHYAARRQLTILATSAGFDTVIEVIKQNGENKNLPELNIAKVYGAVPCVVAKNEKEFAIFRDEESEKVTRFKTIVKFGGHCAINLVESTIKNPRGTWDSRGIISTWAKHPLLLLMLPLHFAGHTKGTDFVDIVNAAEKHGIILVSGKGDPLTAEEQYQAINGVLEAKGHENRIDHRIKANRGHVCYPIAVEDVLNDLGISKPIPVAGSVSVRGNALEVGLKLVTSTAEQAASLATKKVAGIGRLGGRVISSVLHHEAAETAKAA